MLNINNVDILIEVPYLWLDDGYGQSAPLLIELIDEVCTENNLTWALVAAQMLDTQNPKTSKKFSSHFVDKKNLPSSKILFRYHYPKTERYKSDKLISMTMFETDSIPSGWIPILNESDAVVVPHTMLQMIFGSELDTPVNVIHLPLDKLYYEILSEEELVGNLNERFTVNFVGTPNYKTDRKGIQEFAPLFSKEFKGENALLLMKSRGHLSKLDNVISLPGAYSVKKIRDIYLSTHLGAYPSRGEGYGLPQVENSLMGRQVLMAYNSSAIWLCMCMPWVMTFECEWKPAKYENRTLGNPGNWGYCDMQQFVDYIKREYEKWTIDKDAYSDRIVKSHLDNILREELSYEMIKSQIKDVIFPML